MTLTDMAKQLGVTTMTIYRRCEKNGVNLDDLRDGHRGPLTSEGVAIIASMFDPTGPQTAPTGDATQTEQNTNGVTEDAPQAPQAASAAVLQAKLDGMVALVEQLTGERDRLAQQVTVLQAMLAAEQRDRAQERLALTGGDEVQHTQPQRRWWAWWRR